VAVATKNLTENQQKFLDVLYEEAEGDIRTAMNLAGYSPTTAKRFVTEPLADEIAELTKKFIAQSSTKAIYSMYSVLEDPTALGNKERMTAAKDFLDRAGFAKTEKVEVTASTPLFILPEKKED
jgi:hypothetical protein